jgi:hypothetical protein
MSQLAVQSILQQIDLLSDEDRVDLTARLAERTESEWRTEAISARRIAQERGITQSSIDEAVERVRYGK